MKVIVECNPDVSEPEATVFNKFKEWCDLAFSSGYTIAIEGTELKFEKKKEDGSAESS